MRKKLSLFLVMLMALTMVLGTGITAMAAEPPEGAPSSVRQCTHTTNGSALWYVTRIEGDNVKVLNYNYNDGNYTGSGECTQPRVAFGDSIIVGRVYHYYAGKYYFCNDNLLPEGAPLSVRQCTHTTNGSALWYVTRIEGDNVKVLNYNYNDGNYTGSGECTQPRVAFGDSIIVGRVYHYYAGKYYFCNDNLPEYDTENWVSDENSHWHAAVNGAADDVIDKAAHTWDEGKITKAATCTEDGVRTFTCTVCQKTKTEKIEATGHSFDADKWTSDENSHWHAATCGDTEDVKDKAAHTWDAGKVTKEATCTENGVRTFTCTVCQKTKTEKIEATGHSFDTDKWTSDENSHWHAATCGDTEDVKDKAAHTCDAGKVTKEATVDSTGVMTYTCSVCKAVKTVEIPKLTPTVAPTPTPEPVIIITPQETQESQGTSGTQGAAESQGTAESQETAESADTPGAEDGKVPETEKDEADGRTSETEEGEKAATVETVKSDLAEVFTENKVAVTEQGIESAVPATKKDSAYYDESGKKITNSFIRTSDNKYRYVGTTGKSVKKAVVATVDAATGEMKMYYADKTGVIVRNKVVTLPDGDKIFASEDGTLATDRIVTSGKHQYYAGSNGKFLKNKIIRLKDGTRYYANRYGYIRKNALFTAPDGDKRYATADGTLAKNCWVTVGKKMYWCNKIGRITKSKLVEGN